MKQVARGKYIIQRKFLTRWKYLTQCRYPNWWKYLTLWKYLTRWKFTPIKCGLRCEEDHRVGKKPRLEKLGVSIITHVIVKENYRWIRFHSKVRKGVLRRYASLFPENLPVFNKIWCFNEVPCRRLAGAAEHTKVSRFPKDVSGKNMSGWRLPFHV